MDKPKQHESKDLTGVIATQKDLPTGETEYTLVVDAKVKGQLQDVGAVAQMGGTATILFLISMGLLHVQRCPPIHPVGTRAPETVN